MAPMTETEAKILLLAADAGDRLRYRTVLYTIGGEPWHVLNSLKLQGALEHVAYDHWRITEKGRIAAALLRHRAVSRETTSAAVTCA